MPLSSRKKVPNLSSNKSYEDLFESLPRAENTYANQSSPGHDRTLPNDALNDQADKSNLSREHAEADCESRVAPKDANVAPDQTTPRNYKPIESVQFKGWLTVREVAGYFGVSVSTIWRWSKQDSTFPIPRKFGGSTRWKRAEIEKHLGTADHDPSIPEG